MAEQVTLNLRDLGGALTYVGAELEAFKGKAINTGIGIKQLDKLTKDYQGEVATLQAYLGKGTVTQATYNQRIREATDAYVKNTNAAAALGHATRGLQGNYNKMGTAVNQASFQVNDFFVQVSSGTDAMVALGQQGSQLAQILTMFGGGLAVFGAGLSVAIPIVTSLLRSLDVFGDDGAKSIEAARREADKLLSTLEDMRDARALQEMVEGFDGLSSVITRIADRDLKSLEEAMDKAIGENFGEKLANVVGVLGAAGTTLLTGAKFDITDRLAAEAAAREKISKYVKDAVLNADTLLELEKEIAKVEEKRSSADLSKKQELALDQIIYKLTEEYNKRTEVVNAQQETVDLLGAELKHGKDSLEYLKLTAEQRRLGVVEKAKEKNLSGELLEDVSKLAQQEKDLTVELFEQAKAEEKARKASENAKKEAQHTNSLKIEILGNQIRELKAVDLTKESINKIVELELERLRLQKGIGEEANKIEQQLLDSKEASLRATLNIREVTEEQQDKTIAALKKAISDRLKINGLTEQSSALEKEIYLNKLLGNEADKDSIEYARASLAFDIMKAAEADKIAVKAQESFEKEMAGLHEKMALFRAEMRYGKDTLAYARAKNLIELESYQRKLQSLGIEGENVKALVDQKSAMLELIALEDDRIRKLQKTNELYLTAINSSFKLGEGLGKAVAEASDKDGFERVAVFLKEIAKAFLATQLAVLAFETFMVSVLRVPQDIAGAIAGQIVLAGSKLLEFANGGVISNGVQAFADGGVVSSPTYFPMKSGVGLMGEAGPEAIMPLKRGRDGKLGVAANDNGSPVIVQQTFNFSANGDESVKRIIAQEAPKIASMTKREIVDDRRRGGVTRGAFI